MTGFGPHHRLRFRLINQSAVTFSPLEQPNYGNPSKPSITVNLRPITTSILVLTVNPGPDGHSWHCRSILALVHVHRLWSMYTGSGPCTPVHVHRSMYTGPSTPVHVHRSQYTGPSTPVHASMGTPVHASMGTPVHASMGTPVHA